MSILVTYPDTTGFPVPLPAGTPSGTIAYANSDIDNLPTINFNVGKEVDSSFEITAQGDLAFDLIKFIEAIRNYDVTTVDPNDSLLNYITIGKGAHFDVVVTDDCCGDNSQILFQGTADVDTINYCSDDCTTNFTLLDSSEKGQILKCLNSRTFREREIRDLMFEKASLIDKVDGGCTNGGDCLDITAIRQCTNLKPNSIQYSLLALLFLLTPISLLLFVVVNVILGIIILINLLAALFGFTPISGDFTNNISSLLDSFTGFFTNCKLKNRPIAIRVKTYLEAMCDVCNISGGYVNTEEFAIKSVWGDYTNYHLTRQARENRNYQDVRNALEKETVSINNIVDRAIFMEFLEDIEDAFSIETRVVFNTIGEPVLQIGPKRKIYNWLSTSASAYIDLETSEYGDTTQAARGFDEAVYCLEAREEPFTAGYSIRYKDDVGDEDVGLVAEKHYYEDDVLWGSDVNPEEFTVNTGFKGVPSVDIPYAAAGTTEMDSSISIYNSAAYGILSAATPVTTDAEALLTSKSSFNGTKLVDVVETSDFLPVFSPDLGAYVSKIPLVNYRIFLGLKYRAYLKNSLFSSVTPDAAVLEFEYYTSRLNNLKDIIELSGNITPAIFENYFFDDVLGTGILYNLDTGNNQLEDNVYCEVPLYTGTIELTECSCDILQYFKTLTVSENIPMIEFDGVGQFALDSVQINFDDRQIILTGGIYGSRVFI